MNHDFIFLLGHESEGDLYLTEECKDLYFEIKVPENSPMAHKVQAALAQYGGTLGTSFYYQKRYTSLEPNEWPTSAINQLRAFINQVNGFIRARKLTPEEGQELIDYANSVIEQIQG